MTKPTTILITTLALGITAFAAHAAEPAYTLESLRAELTPEQRQAADQLAIYKKANTDPAFYQSLKAANWAFEGVVLNKNYQQSASLTHKDYDVIDPAHAASSFNIGPYQTWIASQVATKGETLAAYDWLQSQRLVVVGAPGQSQAAKLEFIDALSAQILAAAKARQ